MGIEGRLVVSSRPVYMKDEFLSCCASALSEEKNRIGEDSPKTRLFHYVVVPEKNDEVENKWPEKSVGRSIAAAMRIMMKGGGGGMDSKKDDFGNNIKSLFTTHGIEVETSQPAARERKPKDEVLNGRESIFWWMVGWLVAPSQASQLIPISAAAAAVAVALGKLKCSWQPTT